MKNHLGNDLASASKERKPYAKPSVKKVPLRPEEAVLGGCKNSLSAGPIQGDCTNPTACSVSSIS